MSSLHLRGNFIKFATNNRCLPSASGSFYCASTGFIAAPRMYIAVYLLSSIRSWRKVLFLSLLLREHMPPNVTISYPWTSPVVWLLQCSNEQESVSPWRFQSWFCLRYNIGSETEELMIVENFFGLSTGSWNSLRQLQKRLKLEVFHIIQGDYMY